MTAHPASDPAGQAQQDARDWAHYIDPGERLLGTCRPDDTFRLYGKGKAIILGSGVFVVLMLASHILFGGGRGWPGMIFLSICMLGLAVLLGVGPALLDQRNRRARRYAVTDRRALEFQDIRHGRLRAVAFGPTTRALRLYNENMDSFELAIVTLDQAGRAGRSVVFQRLSEAQITTVLQTLWRAGIDLEVNRDTRNLSAMGLRKKLMIGDWRR